MIRHIAMFRWSAEATGEQKQAVSDALDALPGLIPAIHSYSHGVDLGLFEGNFDYAVAAEFRSADDVRSYIDHPDHQRVVRELVSPIRTDRAAIQFEI